MMRVRRAGGASPFVLALLATVWAAPARAQQKALTLDDIYDPQHKVEFSGQPVTGLAWIDDTHYLWPRTEAQAKTTELLKVDALTGNTQPLFDVARFETTLGTLEGVTPEDAKRLARQRSYVMDESRRALVLTIGSDLYLYDLASGRARRLTRAAGDEEEPTVQPGRAAGGLRARQQPVRRRRGRRRERAPDDRRHRRASSTASSTGCTRRRSTAAAHTARYWWSPDSHALAFLQLDERRVSTLHAGRRHPVRPERRDVALSEGGRSEPHGEAGRRRRRRRRRRAGWTSRSTPAPTP